jgi:aquaporin Z
VRPPEPGFHWRIWAAEAAGTALMVLAIVAAATLALADGSPVAEVLPGRGAGFLVLGAIVAPCVALIAVSPLGRLSGAHLNPAVTVGFWTLGRVCGHDLVGFVAAQLLGGLAGALAARLVLPAPATDSIGGAVTHPEVALGAAIALEAGMTALLLAVVLLFVSVEGLARWTPLALVPLLTAIIWLGSPWTGASLNPARSEGPAVAFGDLADLWLYFLAPVLGALLVGGAWRRLSMRPKTAKLFHDPRYRCTFATELPAVTGSGPGRTMSAWASGRSPAASEGAAGRSPLPGFPRANTSRTTSPSSRPVPPRTRR